MAVAFCVKNTFLDVSTLEPAPLVRRRSTSVPCAFKPGDCGSDNAETTPRSNESTSASDNVPDISPNGASSDSDYQDIPDYHSDCTDFEGFDCFADHSGEYCSDCTEEIGANRVDGSPDILDDVLTDAKKGKVTLSLVDMVRTEDVGSKAESNTRSKLRSQARPFASVRQTLAEVLTVISSAVEVLRSGPDIVDVQVQDGGMGGTTTITAQSSSPEPDAAWIMSLAKDALLRAAEQSESTYIFGYGAKPFNTLDSLSFSGSIACVPAAHQATACWDTYEKGFCPRCSSCRWDHPSETDTMRVIVMVLKSA